MMYQAVAMATEMITSRPTLRAGTLTSSADCGMTSKPINKKGMAINTVKKPAVPGVNKGSIFDTSPRVAEPKIINTPTASKKNTVKFWAMDACLTPRTFNQVMMIAPMTPINAHVRCTVCPATSHSGIALISGKIYATVRGNATASKATMVTYPPTNAHEPIKANRGPRPRNTYWWTPPANGIAEVSSEYTSPTAAIMAPPTTTATTEPMVPASSIQPPVSTTQPKPIIAPKPKASASIFVSVLASFTGCFPDISDIMFPLSYCAPLAFWCACSSYVVV